MYIWRGKNRRDRRNFLLDGVFSWGPSSKACLHNSGDETLRMEKELFHVQYFKTTVKDLISKYLLTSNGAHEIELVSFILSEENKTKYDLMLHDQKDSINQLEIDIIKAQQLFRKHSIKESDKMDVDGLNSLLIYINANLSKSELEKYLKK